MDQRPKMQFAREAFDLLVRRPGRGRLLDIGCGRGDHAQGFRAAGFDVTTIGYTNQGFEPDWQGDYADYTPTKSFHFIWASHVLEHQPNPGAFLRKAFSELYPGGTLAVTVPPPKTQLVGGHVSLWTPGLLIYHLVLAGFDCSQAAVKTYGYNISVVVRKERALLPALEMDAGDIERLAQFFPIPVQQDCDGWGPQWDVGWEN